MAGRKHHTVPQFLLRAFANRTSGKEAYVWTNRRGDGGMEINTKNIGAERDFYSHELDARITDLETGFAHWPTPSVVAMVLWTYAKRGISSPTSP